MTSITLHEILEKEAWCNISSRMPISLDMLEKYAGLLLLPRARLDLLPLRFK